MLPSHLRQPDVTLTSHSMTTTPSSDSTQDSSSVEIVVDGVQDLVLNNTSMPTAFASTIRAMKQRAEQAEYDHHMTFFPSDSAKSGIVKGSLLDEVKTTPVFSGDVLKATLDNPSRDVLESAILPQYGLLAQRSRIYGGPPEETHEVEASSPPETSRDGRIFLNVNAPWSAFICGSQGSGKSHTLSCMLENSLLSSKLGKLPSPLAAIVFHYDKFSSFSSAQVCEAAYLCSSGIPVRVLVSPSNYWGMKRTYSNLPGLPIGAQKPQVTPFLLRDQHLDVERIMNLMAVKGKEDGIPLYIEVILRVLRQMAMENQGASGLNYRAFKSRLEQEGFTGKQTGPLNLRLELLESFMEGPGKPGSYYIPQNPSVFTETKQGKAAKRRWMEDEAVRKATYEKQDNIWSFQPGSLTIVDLSCPFVDDGAACALFDIALALFLEKREASGRIVALDEAHKFLSSNASATQFTETLLQVIRQQRHLATRVVIATQEPTISPKLLDLSSMTIVHRFTSPEWLGVLKAHLAGVASLGLDSDGEEDDRGSGSSKRDVKEIFRTIVNLEAGEALLFSPSAILDVIGTRPEYDEGVETDNSGTMNPERAFKGVRKLGMQYVKMRVRSRVTNDGGKSILAA